MESGDFRIISARLMEPGRKCRPHSDLTIRLQAYGAVLWPTSFEQVKVATGSDRAQAGASCSHCATALGRLSR